MQGIRTITLDLDDTLWPIGPVIQRAEARLYAWLAAHYPGITEMFSPEAIRQVRNAVIAEHGDRLHDLAFLRRTVLGRMSEAAGYGTGMVDDAFSIFNEERNRVDVFPEVRPALARLRRSYTLVALTNGNANLSKIGLRDLFDDVVSATTAGAAKPDREIFDLAVQAGGAAAHETLHVGDDPEHDVHGARLAGLRTAWVNRNGDEWPEELPAPDRIVRDVGDLAALLAPANP
ncbi:MAG TPA: HAD family hydrolase [Woeseiaceae bacterium]|nr:HAD family hydrolase [Woeseiaceae bacterium]